MDPEVDACERLGLLASAISGQRLEVAVADPGVLSWTDGRTVFVPVEADHQTQLQCVLLQASLLCAGSLKPEILQKLTRKSAAARRYLSLEGHRALTSLRDVLPVAAFLAADPLTAGRTDSPDSSLTLALGVAPIPDPPASFGVIRPGLVGPSRDGGTEKQGLAHLSRQDRQTLLRELEDEVGEGPAIDILSSPVGGAGPIGRLLKRLLKDTRSSGTGAPGADAPTRFSRSGNRVSRKNSFTPSRMTVSDGGALGAAPEFVYPEWDARYRRYRPRWCTVVELQPEETDLSRTPLVATRSLRRALARLGTELEPHRRQPQGEDLDLDALVDCYVEVSAGSLPDDDVYVENQRSRRDLSVLILLDISGSAGEPSRSGGVVHEHQRSGAAGLTGALCEVGDRVALYGFRSQGRSAVHTFPVKRFDEGLSALAEGRLGGLRPGGFTRLGAAIRHGAAVLDREGGTSRRLLVVLSDGFAYDHGYEGSYGEADARRSLSEARHCGIGCLCLSIAATTDAEALSRVFGTAAHATLGSVDQMADAIAPLFRVALATADLQRRRSERVTRSTERLSLEGRIT